MNLRKRHSEMSPVWQTQSTER